MLELGLALVVDDTDELEVETLALELGVVDFECEREHVLVLLEEVTGTEDGLYEDELLATEECDTEDVDVEL